jgi:hypothetical protein
MFRKPKLSDITRAGLAYPTHTVWPIGANSARLLSPNFFAALFDFVPTFDVLPGFLIFKAFIITISHDGMHFVFGFTEIQSVEFHFID